MRHSAEVSELFFNKPNANGRRYRREAVLVAVDEFIKKGTPLIGECGNDRVGPFVELRWASHEVKEITPTDEGLVITIETLDTPMGKALATMIENDCVDFYMRSFGYVNEYGEVTNISNIVSFDAELRAKE